MSKRKPKPATAGEKIAWDCKGNDSLVYLRTGRGVVVTEARKVSRRIDRAIARAVKKERERCGTIARDCYDLQSDRWESYEKIIEGVDP